MKRPMLGITLVIMLVVLSYGCIFCDHLNPPPFKERKVEFVGIVDSRIKSADHKTTFVLKNVRHEKPRKWQVTVSGYNQDPDIKALRPGAVIRGIGQMSLARGKHNPGGFNYYVYLKSKHIDACLYLPSGSSVTKIGEWRSPYYSILAVREKLIDVCNDAFAPKAAHLITGICFGELQGDTELRQQFSDAGIAHVLAVSGLHTGYLCMLVLGLCCLFELNDRKTFGALAVVLLVYIALTGFSVSVIRASIMLLAASSGRVFKRHVDTLSALGLAASVILLIWPYCLFTASFQMSFGAVLAFVLFNQPLYYRVAKAFHIEDQETLAGQSLSTILTSMTALIGTWPATMVHFHRVSVIGLVGNILLVPIVGVLLIVSWIVLPLLLLFPDLKAIFGFIPAVLSGVIIDFTQQINRLGFLNFSSGRWIDFVLPLSIMLAVFAFYAAGYIDLDRKRDQAALLACASLLSIWMILPAVLPGKLKIIYLDVGQGDAAVIETPNGYHYMIDGGGYEPAVPGQSTTAQKDPISESVLLPALYSEGIDHLDGVFISHNHADHAQGLEELIDGKIPVGRIYVSSKYNGPLLKQKHTPITQLGENAHIESPDHVDFQILWPDTWVDPLPDDEQNEHSMVIRCVYQKKKFLFTGDAGLATEAMLPKDGVKADVLKVGHHGSASATSTAFLKKVRPTLAVISVGAYNRYGHPNPQVLKRLKKQRIPYLRTDQNGAVSLTTDGKIIKVRTYSR